MAAWKAACFVISALSAADDAEAFTTLPWPAAPTSGTSEAKSTIISDDLIRILIFPFFLCPDSRHSRLSDPPPLSPALAPVGEELFESLVRERVLEELLHHLERHRGDIRPDARRLDDVHGAANAGREHLQIGRAHV